MNTQNSHIKFSATLGSTEKIITYAVGIGVGVGVPLILAIIFYLILGEPYILLLPMPFLIAISISYFYSPKGYFIKGNKIHIHRKIGNTKGLPINQIQSIIYPATYPSGFTAGLLCVAGIFGAFGVLWNKSWGVFQMYVTNNSNRVELLTKKGTHIILSPDDPQGFISEINKRLDGINNI